MKTSFVFIDGPNLYQTLLITYGSGKMDFERFVELVGEGTDVTRVYYYNIEGPEQQQPFIDYLQSKGFILTIIPPKYRGDKGFKERGIDVSIAVDMVKTSFKPKTPDVMILVSGDSDLVNAVKAVKDNGIQVKVVGVPSSTSPELVKISDEYLPIDFGMVKEIGLPVREVAEKLTA